MLISILLRRLRRGTSLLLLPFHGKGSWVGGGGGREEEGGTRRDFPRTAKQSVLNKAASSSSSYTTTGEKREIKKCLVRSFFPRGV